MKEQINGYSLSLWGHEEAKNARAYIGTPVDDESWLVKTSKILKSNEDWDDNQDFYADGVSHGTWRRYLYGPGCRRESFNGYCDVLNLEAQQVRAKNRFGWSNGISEQRKQELQQIKDSGQRILTLVRHHVDKEVKQVSEINGVSERAYSSFLEEVAWFMRKGNLNYIEYVDLIHIAVEYLSRDISRRLLLPETYLIKQEKPNEKFRFFFCDEAISDYLIAQRIVASLNQKESVLLASFQTTYHEDILISRLIDDQSEGHPNIGEFVKDRFLHEDSKVAAVNHAGILAKRLKNKKDDFLKQIINFVLSDSDVKDLYRLAVIRRVLGRKSDNPSGKISSIGIERLKREVVTGNDPIAAIFCLKIISKQECMTELKKIFANRYSNLVVEV